MRTTIAAVCAAAILLIGCDAVDSARSAVGLAPAKQALRGTFRLTDVDSSGPSISGAPGSCRGTGGYSDFGPGMNVTVRDGSGAIIATGVTRSFDALPAAPDYDDIRATGEVGGAFSRFGVCLVWFELEVPETDFYEVSVGRRGEISYSREDLETADWLLSLSLGN